MNAPLWHQEVLLAHTAEAVLCVVHDYLVLWRPDELAQLPEPCSAALFVDPHDVSDYAACLLGHEGEGRRSPAREALTAFFTVAARRLAELDAGQPRLELVAEPVAA